MVKFILTHLALIDILVYVIEVKGFIKYTIY